LNILHAYITGPIIYQSEDTPLLAPGRIIGLFRLSYLTPGLMAAGVTEVIVEKDQFVEAKDDTKTLKNNTPPTTTKALTHQSKKSKWIKKIHSENKKNTRISWKRARSFSENDIVYNYYYIANSKAISNTKHN